MFGFYKKSSHKFLLMDVQSFIDKHFVDESKPDAPRKSAMMGASPEREAMMRSLYEAKHAVKHSESAYILSAPSAAKLEDLMHNLDEPFSATLLRLIDASGKKDSEIYNKANIDRRLFSKIRSNANYTPSKSTVLAFAVALELSLAQTTDLLSRAGFALSRSRKFDVIVEYFISKKKYDIFVINEVLFSYDQSLLGG